MARTTRRNGDLKNYDFDDRELDTTRKPVRKQDRLIAARQSVKEAELDTIYFNQTESH